MSSTIAFVNQDQHARLPVNRFNEPKLERGTGQRPARIPDAPRWKTNEQLEIGIAHKMGVEEERRIQAASLGAERDRSALMEDARRSERESCAAICDEFPDNLMARHIGDKIRGRR